MQSKILSKRTLLMIAFSWLIFSATLFVYFFPQNLIRGNSALLIENATANLNPEHTNNALLPASPELQRGEPVRLKIPSINVDTSFEYVGLTPQGAMDIPKGPDKVAWFNIGPRPGGNGTAVISGHYGWENNTPAVFDDLHKLRIGDKVSVEDEKGVVTTFVVRETRIYSKNDVVPGVFVSSDGKARLNLITCTGDWNTAEETYSERLVVFTDALL